MDDKFLYQLREQPRAEFAENLHRKLAFSRPALLLQDRMLKPAFSLLLIGLALVIALMSVTPVRSAVMSFLIRVGGQSFDVTTDYPGDNYPEEEEITIVSRTLPLNEAVALLPYPVYLPQNVVLEQDVAVSELSPGNFHIFLRGRTQQGVRFNMYILTNPDTNGGEIIFPDSVEEIFLDANHPAALIRGGWNDDTKVWDNYGLVRIKWTLDNLLYELEGNIDDLETLLEVARSMLP